MKNIKMTVKDGKLHVEIDLKEKGVPSSSGKSYVIASTNGNQRIDGTDDIHIGVNVYKPVK